MAGPVMRHDTWCALAACSAVGKAELNALARALAGPPQVVWGQDVALQALPARASRPGRTRPAVPTVPVQGSVGVRHGNPTGAAPLERLSPSPPPASAPTQTPLPGLSHPPLCCARSSECTAEQGQEAPACGRWVLQGLWGWAGARGRFLALAHRVRFLRYCHDSAQHLQHSCHQCFKCLHRPPTVTQQEEVSGSVLQMHRESRHPACTLPSRVEASSPRLPPGQPTGVIYLRARPTPSPLCGGWGAAVHRTSAHHHRGKDNWMGILIIYYITVSY